MKEANLNQNEVEAALIEIWKDLLELDAVGLDEEFVQLGGDSITALRVLPRITEKFGFELPTRILFEYGTIRELASAMIEFCASADRVK